MSADAKFIVLEDGSIVCEHCRLPMDDHKSKVEVDGPFKGWTRYSCITSDVDA
jgi:hypothetical protein